MQHDVKFPSPIAPKYGRPPLKNLTVDTIDLSEYLDFNFYNPVWYWDTLSGEKGEASHRVGAGMWYWVLNEQQNVISRSMVQHVTKEDILYSILKKTLELADNKINGKLADNNHKL